MAVFARIPGGCLHLFEVCKRAVGPFAGRIGTTVESEQLMQTEKCSFFEVGIDYIGHVPQHCRLAYRRRRPTLSVSYILPQTWLKRVVLDACNEFRQFVTYFAAWQHCYTARWKWISLYTLKVWKRLKLTPLKPWDMDCCHRQNYHFRDRTDVLPLTPTLVECKSVTSVTRAR